MPGRPIINTSFNKNKMKTWIKIAIGLLFAGIIGAAFIYYFIYNKQHPDYEHEKAVYTLSANSLYHSFRDNGEAATKLYTGKVIEINGKLAKTEPADSIVVAVFVFNQGMFGDEGIRCTMLPKFNDATLGLSPDSEVSIKGYCTGYNDTDVILEKCSIIINH